MRITSLLWQDLCTIPLTLEQPGTWVHDDLGSESFKVILQLGTLELSVAAGVQVAQVQLEHSAVAPGHR